MEQIAPNLYTFTGLMAGRVYLIVDPEGLTFIDTSLPTSPKRIIKQLGEIGRGATDVKRILITHAHPDHFGGLPELVRLTGAEVWASAGAATVLRGEAAVELPPTNKVPWPQRIIRLTMPAARCKPTPVRRILADGDTLDIMGGLQVIATPGHAPDHISFWQPETRTLFAGDTMIHLYRPLDPIFWPPTVDMAENTRSVRKLAKLEPQIILCGHGSPLTEGAAAKLHRLARKRVKA